MTQEARRQSIINVRFVYMWYWQYFEGPVIL